MTAAAAKGQAEKEAAAAAAKKLADDAAAAKAAADAPRLESEAAAAKKAAEEAAGLNVYQDPCVCSHLLGTLWRTNSTQRRAHRRKAVQTGDLDSTAYTTGEGCRAPQVHVDAV